MKYLQTISVIVAVALITGASYAGYLAGNHFTAETFQKQAVAHSCGIFDRVSPNKFSFVVPPMTKEAEKAAKAATNGKPSAGIQLPPEL